MGEVPSTTVEEPLSFYSVARDVNKTEDCSKSVSNLSPRPVYAVVTKGKKKNVESHESCLIMDDVVKMDSGDVIMCENTDLYDATTDDERIANEENEYTFADKSRNFGECKKKCEKDHENSSTKKILEKNRNKDGSNSAVLNEDSTLYSDTVNFLRENNFDNTQHCSHKNVDENRKDITSAVYENISDSTEKPR